MIDFPDSNPYPPIEVALPDRAAMPQFCARMITLFHVLTFAGAVAGFSLGFALGTHYFGWVGATIFAPVLCFAGYHLGNIPWILVLRGEKRRFDRESTEELIEGLNGKYAFCPNLVLATLRIRGVDIRGFLPYLCDLMDSDDVYTRNRGWVALRSALPEYAEMIPSYLPSLSREECSKLVKTIRNA